MPVLWHKVRHDLWHHRRRTLTAIVSIAAGLFGIGGIFGMVDRLLVAMDAAHVAVQPSHVNLILRDFVPGTALRQLTAVPGVATLEPVAQLPVRYRFAPDDAWSTGILVTRGDFDDQRLDTMALVEGAFPAAGRIAVERLTRAQGAIDVGDRLTLDANGRTVGVIVGGVVRHPFVEPPTFGGRSHFFAADLSDFGVPVGLFNQVLVRVEPDDEATAREVAATMRAELARRGVEVAATLFQSSDAHWGRTFVEGITTILRVMALLALLLSLALVTNTFTALLTQQTDQIGVMKALGARRRTVLQVYLGQVLAIGALALALSLPAALLFVDAMTRWFLDLFNVPLDAFQLSPKAVAVQVAAAVVAPLLAALPPVLRASRMSVRAALSTYGIGQDYRSGRLDRAVERVAARRLPTLHAAALGNLLRRKGRLGFTVATLTLAGVMFLIVTSLADSIYLTLDREQARQRYDVEVGFDATYDDRTLLEAVADVGAVVDAQVWFVRGAILWRGEERIDDDAGLGTELVALPDDPWYRPIVVAGRWLRPDDGRALVIAADTAARNALAVGDTLVVDLGPEGRQDWTIVGTYRRIYGGGFVSEAVYAPRPALLASLGGEPRGTRLLAVTGSPDLGAALRDARAITDRLQAAGFVINPYVTRVKLEQRAFADSRFSSTTGMLFSLALLVATIGAIGLSGALGISVMEQTREIGVMRATGASTRDLYALFLTEGLLQAVASWLLAVPLGWLLAAPLARRMGQAMLETDLDFAFAWWAVAAWLATVVVIAALATLVPARQAARTRVRESLAYG
jgi:putative ABC transport system permease protein